MGYEKFCIHCGTKVPAVEEAAPKAHAALSEEEIMRICEKAEKLSAAGCPEEELRVLLEGLEQVPTNTMLLLKTGRAYRKNSKIAQAVDCYEKVIQLDPSEGTAYTNLCTIHATQGRYAAAEECARRGIELMESNQWKYTQSDRAVAYANCAASIGLQGRKKEALGYLKQAERLGYPNGKRIRDMIK